MSESAESLVFAPVCFGPRTDKDDAKPEHLEREPCKTRGYGNILNAAIKPYRT
jgi:hypothetical protein